MLFFAAVLSINLCFAHKWTALRIDCTNDGNVACLKWTEQRVDFSGCVYVQVDLTNVARKSVTVYVNIYDGDILLAQKEVRINKGEETSYAKEVYLGKSMEGQTVQIAIESISCN